MIKKILELKNIGRFKKMNTKGDYWTGNIEENNIIYADNGSGKTTLSLVFESVNGDDFILRKKKSFLTNEDIKIKLLSSEGKQIIYSDNSWNEHVKNIEVFNSFYVEDNIYVINVLSLSKGQTEFELLFGKDNVKIQKRKVELEKKIVSLRYYRNKFKKQLKEGNLPSDKRKVVEERIAENLVEVDLLVKEQARLKHKSIKLSEKFKNQYLESVNHYLSLFNPDLEITKLSQRAVRVVYGLKVFGKEVSSKSEKGEKGAIRFALSEGDKNALAFAFFLTNIDLAKNIHEKLIVIDDPVTSYDTARKNTTINLLDRLSRRVKKLIVLTHDKQFANELSSKFSYKCQNLKIVSEGDESQIVYHNIRSEMYTGIFKDLNVLRKFIENGAKDEYELREICRCVRPVLEGVLRIKYFGHIKETEWLGDMISHIRGSDENSVFHHSKPVLTQLRDINNYTKSYHHSNPVRVETPINPRELKLYVKRTLDILTKI